MNRVANQLVFPWILIVACTPARVPTTADVDFTATLPTTANEHGWTVEVTTLEARVTGIRLYEGEALLSSLGDRFWNLVVPRAHAHPGHYEPGEAMAEWLGAVTIDLLNGPSRVGTASAFTGTASSAWLDYGTLDGGGALHLAGTARKGADTRPFEVRLDVASPISGIPGEHALTGSPSPFTLSLDLARVLTAADFVTTTDDDNDSTFELPADSQAHRALTRGVLDVGAYTIHRSEEH